MDKVWNFIKTSISVIGLVVAIVIALGLYMALVGKGGNMEDMNKATSTAYVTVSECKKQGGVLKQAIEFKSLGTAYDEEDHLGDIDPSMLEGDWVCLKDGWDQEN